MPREVILNRDGGPWSVKVGWSGDRDVQLGVESDDGRSIPWLLFGSGDPDGQLDALRRLGDKVRTIFHAVANDRMDWTEAERNEEMGRLLLNSLDVVAGQQYNGLWSTLDRQGVNRLIRILRKARDAAFGADA